MDPRALAKFQETGPGGYNYVLGNIIQTHDGLVHCQSLVYKHAVAAQEKHERMQISSMAKVFYKCRCQLDNAPVICTCP